MARPEKTVVDALDRPEYAGDLPEITAMLCKGRGRLDWDRLVRYALRMGSHPAARFGPLPDLHLTTA